MLGQIEVDRKYDHFYLRRSKKLKKFLKWVCKHPNYVGTDYCSVYQHYFYKSRGIQFTVLREIGTCNFFIKQDDKFAKAMGFGSLIDMMSYDWVLDSLNEGKEIFGYWPLVKL